MNFDIKDVKSWFNRHDVKRGDKGYFFDDICSMKDKKDCTVLTISGILDNKADCFCIKNTIGVSSFNFFLPLDATKKDKPKEKYRPFKNKEEICDYLDFNFLVGHSLCFRNCNDSNNIKSILIVSAEYNNHILIRINGCDLKWWFDNYECRVKGKWLPFGVEVEDE